MRVVINIDDNLYARLFDNGVDNCDDAEDMATAIRKGTVLPRGCGDLIDREELLKQPIDKVNYPSNYVKYAQTIIENDREVSDASGNQHTR